jgi:hypothetical protein
MGIGTSIFLLAVGAILTYAVDVQTQGIDLNVVGVILMIVGGLGILLSMIFWNSWGGFGGREVIIEGEAPRRRRRRIVEREI